MKTITSLLPSLLALTVTVGCVSTSIPSPDPQVVTYPDSTQLLYRDRALRSARATCHGLGIEVIDEETLSVYSRWCSTCPQLCSDPQRKYRVIVYRCNQRPTDEVLDK